MCAVCFAEGHHHGHGYAELPKPSDRLRTYRAELDSLAAAVSAKHEGLSDCGRRVAADAQQARDDIRKRQADIL